MAIRNRDRTEKQKSGSKPEGQRKSLLPTRDVPRRGVRSQNALVRYFQETGDELRKVSWPTRQETLRLSLIVLGSTLAGAILLGLLDLGFHELLAVLLEIS